MQTGKIQCDLCRSEQETKQSGRPAGWALVFTSIRISGDEHLNDYARNQLRAKINKHFSSMHICPSCIKTKLVDSRFQLAYKAS